MGAYRDAYLVEGSGGRRIGVVRRDGAVWRYYRLVEERSTEVYETRDKAAAALGKAVAEAQKR